MRNYLLLILSLLFFQMSANVISENNSIYSSKKELLGIYEIHKEMPVSLEALIANFSDYEYTELEKPDIAPLIQTQWGQGAPYNDCCPEINGGKTVTGCCATAFGQILNYWQPFDNIAEVLAEMGENFGMDYGIYESGCIWKNFVESIIYDYDFDKSLWCAIANYHSPEEYSDLLYTELQKGRPILVSGGPSGAKHAFIIDGYQDELWHVNWGWEGSYDGWYSLKLLKPGYSDFSKNLKVTINLMPNENQTIYPISYVASTLSPTKWEYVKNKFVEFNGSLYSALVHNFYGETGFRCVTLDGEEMYILRNFSFTLNYATYVGFYFNDFPEGSYYIYPGIKMDGIWVDSINYPNNDAPYFVRKQGNKLTISIGYSSYIENVYNELEKSIYFDILGRIYQDSIPVNTVVVFKIK